MKKKLLSACLLLNCRKFMKLIKLLENADFHLIQTFIQKKEKKPGK